jgi:FixJ family two-component response regulator
MSEDKLISIVDDDELARDGIRELVESFGHTVAAFSSAEDFLASSLVEETACLITDLQMPGLSGLELQEALRSQGHRTPEILITAYPSENRQKCALNGGAVGFLSKPFDEGSLIKCLTAAIESSNRQASTAPLSARNQLKGQDHGGEEGRNHYPRSHRYWGTNPHCLDHQRVGGRARAR